MFAVTDTQTTEESTDVKKKEQGKKEHAPQQNRKHRNRKKNKRQNKGLSLPMVDKSLLEKVSEKFIDACTHIVNFLLSNQLFRDLD